MKNFIIVLILGLFSCQSNNNLSPSDPILKAEKFEKNETENKGINYVASEANNPLYSPKFLNEAIQITFQFRDSPWEEGANAMNKLLNRIIEGGEKELDIPSKVDLQIATYLNLDRFIFKAPNGLAKEKYAAENLNRLLKNSEPIEWQMMAKTLKIATPSLKINDFQSLQNYIVNGCKKTIQNPESVLENADEKTINHLKNEAEKAMETLNSK